MPKTRSRLDPVRVASASARVVPPCKGPSQITKAVSRPQAPRLRAIASFRARGARPREELPLCLIGRARSRSRSCEGGLFGFCTHMTRVTYGYKPKTRPALAAPSCHDPRDGAARMSAGRVGDGFVPPRRLERPRGYSLFKPCVVCDSRGLLAATAPACGAYAGRLDVIERMSGQRHQRSTCLRESSRKASRLRPGERATMTCTCGQGLRRVRPALKMREKPSGSPACSQAARRPSS